jgi:hypothetical protein
MAIAVPGPVVGTNTGYLDYAASAAYTTNTNFNTFVNTFVNAVMIDMNITAVSGVTPSMTIQYQRLGADGIWYTIYTSTAIVATGTKSVLIGLISGADAVQSPGIQGRVAIAITGTTPSFTLSYSVAGGAIG